MLITVETPIANTPRVKQVRGMFDLQADATSRLEWDVSLPLDARPWHIGLIVGPSGCGKTTIARRLFPAPLPDLAPALARGSVVDAFPESMPIADVVALLSAVGFSSPPAWLRPFQVLSTGQQFRVTLALLLAHAAPSPPTPLPRRGEGRNTNPSPPTPLPRRGEGRESEPIVFDEYTSVVDRTVAQIGSAALSKIVRQRGQQFVAVTCHEDVEAWLQPDWVYRPAENWVRGAICFWDAQTGQLILRTTGTELAESALHHFTSDSRSVLGLSPGEKQGAKLKLYECRTGKARMTLTTELGQYGAVAISKDSRWVAWINGSNHIDIFDMTGGKVAATIKQTEAMNRLAFSPDGSMLASGGHSGTILLWDMKALVKQEHDEPAWTDADKTALWNDLASTDAEKAFTAMMRLRRSPPQAVALLRERIQWADANKDIGKLIERLGSSDFKTRKQASEALEQLGERARPMLAKAAGQSTSLEHKRRCELLIDSLGKPFSTPVGLRLLRSIEVLDGLRTPDAAALLRDIAAEAPASDPLAREVFRALGRGRP
jgi:energy-coupling factor transporter ATP-binding protein EcfA2